VEKVTRKLSHDEGVRVKGVDDVLVRFAKCCGPVPGDEIVGYITRGRGISVHTCDCSSMAGLANDKERTIEIDWEQNGDRFYPVQIKAETLDKPGMLSKVSSAIASCDVNISGANANTTKEKEAALDFVLQISNLDQLTKVLKSIRRIKGVLNVKRVKDLPWEEEGL